MKGKALHLTVITNTSLTVIVCASVSERATFCVSQSLFHIDITVTSDGWVPDSFDSPAAHSDTKSHFPVTTSAVIAIWYTHTQTNIQKVHTHAHTKEHILTHTHAATYMHTYIRTYTRGNNSLWSPHFPHQKVGQLWLQHQPKMKELSGLSLAQSTLH